MRIRSQMLTRLVGSIGAATMRRWRSTLDIRRWSPVPEADIYDARHAGRYIYAAWHESILAFAWWGMPCMSRFVILISQHQDGEYITQIVERLGLSTIRGSSTHGGRAALREMLQVGPERHLAITPDGPRGPRREFQSGAIYVASRSGRPIIPVGFGFSDAWRAKSWDQFAVPKPFGVICCVLGWPIAIPERLDSAGIEHWRKRVQESMLECTAAAEAWAAGGREPAALQRVAA